MLFLTPTLASTMVAGMAIPATGPWMPRFKLVTTGIPAFSDGKTTDILSKTPRKALKNTTMSNCHVSNPIKIHTFVGTNK